MAIQVSSIEELLDVISESIVVAMDGVTDKVEKDLVDTVTKNVYGTPNGVHYERTNKLLDSIRKSELQQAPMGFPNGRHIVSYKVGHDRRKLTHPTIGYDLGSFAHNLPQVIQEGKAGAIQLPGYFIDAPYYVAGIHQFAEPRPYMDEVRKRAEMSIFDDMKSELRSMGFEVR